MSKNRSGFRSFLFRQDGLAAIEFALVLPMIMVIFIGVIVSYDGYRGFQRASLSSHSVADLTTRLVDIDHDDMHGLLGAGQALLGKHGEQGTFKISVSSVSNLVGEDDYTIDWTESQTSSGGGGFDLTMSSLENINIPEIPSGESLIIARTELTFDLLFSSAPIVVRKVAVRNPRFVSRIGYDPS